MFYFSHWPLMGLIILLENKASSSKEKWRTPNDPFYFIQALLCWQIHRIQSHAIFDDKQEFIENMWGSCRESYYSRKLEVIVRTLVKILNLSWLPNPPEGQSESHQPPWNNDAVKLVWIQRSFNKKKTLSHTDVHGDSFKLKLACLN